MQLRLKYALPLAQMLLASALLICSSLWAPAAMRVCDMPGSTPAFGLLASINAPVAVARTFWISHLPGRTITLADGRIAFFDLVDDATLVAAVGVFWYWVVLNIRCWRQWHAIIMFRWFPLRLATDGILMAVGLLSGFAGLVEGRHIVLASDPRGTGCFGPLVWSNWLSIVIAGFFLSWSIGLIVLFGRDFLHCVVRKDPPPLYRFSK